MNFMMLCLLLVSFVYTDGVFGQKLPIFASAPSSGVELIGEPNDIKTFIANNPSQNQETGKKPSGICNCVAAETKCNGIIINKGTFDIRIVNMGLSPASCPIGDVLCCQNNKKPENNKCGMRKITRTDPNKPVDVAPYGSYPWQAAILDYNNQYIRAGVIISENFVLTAAHVVVGLKDKYKIKLGVWNSESKTEQTYWAYPQKTIIHPNFDNVKLYNDIALIQIQNKIPFENYLNINSACLPTKEPSAKTRCWTAGWGLNAFNNGMYQNILKEVDLPIVAADECEALFKGTKRLGPEFYYDKKSFICAGGEAGKDACTGDGGGALVCQQTSGQFEVVGLTAWGIECAQKDVPSAYVNVYNYLPWIKQNMNQQISERSIFDF